MILSAVLMIDWLNSTEGGTNDYLSAVQMIDSIFLISLLFVHPNQTNMFVVKMLLVNA